MRPAKKNYRVYLEDILAAIKRISDYTTKGEREFLTTALVQDAVIRQLSIVGEAAAKLPLALRAKYATIPWKKIVGMRNIIVHDYSRLNLQRVWDTVERDLSGLQGIVEAMLKKETT